MTKPSYEELVNLLRECVHDEVEGPHYFGEDLWEKLRLAIRTAAEPDK